jgi:hypothetical protein
MSQTVPPTSNNKEIVMAAWIHARSLSLITAASLLSGCGDGGTGPGLPNVAGLYQWREQVGAVSCTPQRPPAEGGTVVLDAFLSEFEVRIRQEGSQVTLIDLAFPNDPGPTGMIDEQGNITLALTIDFQEEPRGSRIFFDNLKIEYNLRRVDNGARLTGTGAYVNVFREGSPNAAVFATCSRSSTIEVISTGA